MGLVLRQQLTNTNGPGLVLKGSELTYAQGDSNFLFLLTNMSGSAISITGNTTIAGTLLVTGLITGTITSANNATSASYIRSTGVDGPHLQEVYLEDLLIIFLYGQVFLHYLLVVYINQEIILV